MRAPDPSPVQRVLHDAALASPPLPVLEGDGMRRQLVAFARDLNEIYRAERERGRQLENALSELEQSYLATVQALALLVEAKDPNTRSHLQRAHDYAVALATRVAPELAQDQALRFGFLLHDVGKAGIPDAVLCKEAPLTAEEWAIMETHPLIGARILAPVKYLARAIPIVESHHERWDGKGYPRGLRGDEIPLGARIFAVADVFDAMTSNRPYRDALPLDRAVEEIVRAGGTQLDPALTEAFADLCSEQMHAEAAAQTFATA